jgi:SAM-dependent methyltransferase
VEAYLRTAGFDRSDPQPATWSRLSKIFPISEVAELNAAITAREEDDRFPAPYHLMWRSLSWAKETYGWFAPITISWLAWLADARLVGKRILDVGCGPGVHTCFVAARFPEAEVIGADISVEGISVARELAAELDLSNVWFVKSDIQLLSRAVVGGPVDVAVATTVLADADPEGFRRPVPGDPWSTSNSVEQLVKTGSVDGLGAIAQLLRPAGIYVGVERAPDAVSYANWLGGLVRAGLIPDASRATQLGVRMYGSAERLPLLVAVRGDGNVDTDSLVSLTRQQFPKAFKEEDALRDDPPLKRIWGIEITVNDAGGPGQTRIEYLNLRSGRTVRFETTTRGYRQLQHVGGAVEVRISEEQDFVRDLGRRDPRVVALRSLDGSPGLAQPAG